MQTLNLEQPNESSCSPLRLIAAAIRACINPLSPPDENAKYLVDLVVEALAVPGAFPNLACLRRENARLRYNYPDDWHLRALLAAVTAFAPGFDPSKPFSVGTWYTGGWEGIGPIADAIEQEANKCVRKRTGRPRKDETDKETLVIAALAAHHEYEQGGSIGNYDPVTVRGLSKNNSGLSTATISRFLDAKFGKPGHKRYMNACTQEKIGVHLAKWQHDLSPEYIERRIEDEYRQH